MKQLFKKSSFSNQGKMVISFNNSNVSKNKIGTKLKRRVMTFAVIIFMAASAFAQATIEGRIVDIEGESLPGVSVKIKGTTTGTVTDLDGYYKLSNVPTDATLEFSFLGMLTEEIEVGDKTTIDVTMVDDIKSLEEVVVVGYGSVKRANLTGAVVDIKAEELEDIPVANLSAALDGKLAGVKISSSTGVPGATTTLKIRTESSFGRVTEDVIYVIDDIIYDGENNGADIFNALDASEIESISVLKDASAAVYGTRAAGGAVIVKTKRGKTGKPQLTYSGSLGLASATKFPEMMNAYDLANMYNNILDIYDTEVDRANRYDYYTDDELAYFDSLGGYNWIDELIQTATVEKHVLNVNGGTENFKYFVGGSIYNEIGMIPNLDFSKYSFRTSIDANITTNLKTTIGLNYQYNNGQRPNINLKGATDLLGGIYKNALTAPPWIPLTIDGLPVNNDVSINPQALFESGSYKKYYGGLTSMNIALEYEAPFIRGLKGKVQFNRTESNDRGKEYSQNFVQYEFPASGTNRHIILENSTAEDATQVIYSNNESIRENSDYNKSYQFNATINYGKTIGVHDIAVLLVYEQSERSDNTFNTNKEAAATIPGYDYLWAYGADDYTSASSYHESANLGYVGRINYSYADKYLFESTFRYEASQKFHPDYRWGFFPAASAGWIISEENFFKNNIRFLNFIKLRGSAGLVGNDKIETFTWKPTFLATDNTVIFGNSNVTTVDARNNLVYIPNVRWQESQSYNIGLDTRFWDNKMKFSIEYYYRYTYNIFNRRENVPTTMGITGGDGTGRVPEENYGAMYAKGIEIEFGYDGNVGNDFKYNIDGNFSWDKHRKLKVIQNPAAVGTWADQLLNDPSNQPGYIALGIMRTQDQLNDWMAKYPDYTINGQPLALGMIYYEDVRGDSYIDTITGQKKWLEPDGKITEDDVTIIAKYTSPPFHYAFSLGCSWKGVRVTATFKGVFGHKVFISKDEQYTPEPNKDISNVFGFWSDYWTPDNPDAAFPRPYRYGLPKQNTTFWMRDGHTLRVSDLNVSYTLPKPFAERLKLSQLKVYCSTKNLFTIINPFDHKDPAISRGYEYPLMRLYNLGVRITL